MKSHEKISLSLLVNLLRDYSSVCGVEPDLRDCQTLQTRVEHEGFEFLTLTLPSFGASLENALENGFIASADFAGFSKIGKIPAFLQVFLKLVFDTSGALRSTPDPMAIAAIRQITYFHKKLKELCKDEKIASSFVRFKTVENELLHGEVHEGHIRDFDRICSLVWDSCLSAINIADAIPKHGPGATADGISGNRKYKMRVWHDRLEGYFPFCANAYNSESVIDSQYWESFKSVPREHEQPVKVICVPKTAKSPRIIAIEPVCMQYTQQALAEVLISVLENSNMTRGHVNFSDQTVNQKLALASSADRRFATIDLSDASDRVRQDFVAPMFRSNPDLLGAIYATRSERANLNGEIISLTKFASMGSALCFPIESMFFYTLCILGILRSKKAPLDYASVLSAASSTYIYGDDIIVPIEHTPIVLETLQLFLCKVNKSKSFYRGSFRESCGQDAFSGVDVTPIYLRRRAPEYEQDVQSILSWVETSNLLYKRGLWLTATAMKNMVENVIGSLPVTGDESEGLGWSSFCYVAPNTKHQELAHALREQRRGVRTRYNKALQRLEYQTFVAKPVYKRDRLTSYPALMKFFLTAQRRLTAECKSDISLERSSRRGVVTLKSRWTRPY